MRYGRGIGFGAALFLPLAAALLLWVTVFTEIS